MPSEPAQPDKHELFRRLVAPHVESFNYFCGAGLRKVVEQLPRIRIDDGSGRPVSAWFEEATVERPMREEGRSNAAFKDLRIFPRECREAGTTYNGALTAKVCWAADGEEENVRQLRLSSFPIMVCSNVCNLSNATSEKLIKHGEEPGEVGGYFVLNGIERIIRLLIQQRRHYIMGMVRGAYARRGPMFTDYATAIRCVSEDETSMTVRIHYLTSGSARVAFVIRRQEFFIPAAVVFKALMDMSDKELYTRVVGAAPGAPADIFAAERCEVLLQELHHMRLQTRAECLAHLGRHFRVVLDQPASASDVAVGEELLRQYLFIHLKTNTEKVALMVLMLQKLYQLVSGQCQGDNPDSMIHQELLLPGLLLQQMVKEKLGEWLERLRDIVKEDAKGRPLDDPALMQKSLSKAAATLDIGRRVEYFLATGNLVSRSGLAMSQTSGFTVVAEKLNYLRYLSHFRSVHRGAYFAELRTTTVRKLLPESWGFMCPVHTPDGSPCGLLNHLAAACEVVVEPPEDPDAARFGIKELLAAAGMVPTQPALALPLGGPQGLLPVMLDGAYVGVVRAAMAQDVVTLLRTKKVDGSDLVPAHLEAALISPRPGGASPGLFLFTHPSRMVRPVRQLSPGHPLELVGALEQAYMSIRCPDGQQGGSADLGATHEELKPTAFLSVVASLTPWSDYNQSPRNMYQCQMAKQTMGTPMHTYRFRADTKLYRLQTPQRPIARTERYNSYGIDDYPLGTMAVVAVLSYTGYDLEDAMIINRSALDRGFAHATLIKTETVDLREGAGRGASAGSKVFGSDPARPARGPRGAPSSSEPSPLDSDGLPEPGLTLSKGMAEYSVLDLNTSSCKVQAFKSEDAAVVSQVAIIGSGEKGTQKASIKMHFNRNPVIGDKFASRHGQKGVLSFQWPDEDMPFCTATGIRPDIIINPHAFPSRMTIGMLVESMASKIGSLEGRFMDATPFQAAAKGSAKQPTPTEVFGEALLSHGYAYHGGESMISGVTGEEFRADIYIGLVYYQRLRHMVSDKFQVRSVGPISQITRQPIKGRKAGGGIRFGEMERDSLLAHGAAFLLHDRLHLCSDRHVAEVCSKCGSLLSTLAGASAGGPGNPRGRAFCGTCQTSKNIEAVALPYVFRYLSTELAAMNIKLSLNIV